VKVRALGIDGCRAGWLYVCQDLATGAISAGVLRSIEEVLAFPAARTVVGIDMPIGIPDAGPRACEKAARRLLGRPRASSVFPVPARDVLHAATYADARRMGKLNLQTWNIVPKIREVDEFLRSHSSYRSVFHEAHPELSFLRWNGGRPMKHSKKSAQGRAEREKLVKGFFGAGSKAARNGLPRAGWANDDFLDAFAVLWTALRVARGEAVGVPETPERDGSGLRMQIIS
jgi:predicted RNase H-like nuclease